MTDTKKTAANHTALHDTLGIVLIVAGALLGVAAFMYIKNGAVENPTMFTATMSWLVEAIGPPAILWLCLGFLFVGARLFLFGNERGSWRDPVGFVATALGLSILMGAIRPESIALGGYWGQKIGGRVSEMGTVAAGVALGLASLLIPAWVVWLRVAPPALIAKANALIGEAPASETEAVSSPQRTTRSATAAKKATEDPSGVTSAEADALLPDAERDEILFALRSANRNTATTANHAPSPYPADVRRDGGIPSGARPIETTHEPRRAAPLADQGAAIIRPTAAPIAGHVPAPGGGSAGGAGPVRTWSAPKSVPSEVSAGADLAPTKDARSVGATSRPASAPELKPAAVEATAKQTLATPAQPPQIGGTAQVARAIPIPSDAGPIGTPTWESDEDLEEQDAVTDDEAVEPEDELVVDAYGTPLELVAALRGETVVTAELQAPPAESEIASDEDEDDFEEVLESDAVEPWNEQPQLSLDEDETVDAEQDGDLEDPLDVEEDDELLPAAAAKLVPDDESESEGSELEAEFQNLEHETEDEIPTGAVNSALSSESFEKGEKGEKGEREVILQPVQNSLFDSTPPPTPVVAKAAPAPVVSLPRERTVVLEPQAGQKARADTSPTSEDLVYRCGMLFLAQKRVAVSMLQREFGLDFKQATAVLDQLQEQGLIGPYLGGQRRDILLTAEEWRARVGAPS